MKLFRILLLFFLIIGCGSIRFNPKVDIDRIPINEPQLPIKKFTPNISADPYLPFRLYLGIGENQVRISVPPTIEGFDLGNGFFIDLHNHFTFNPVEFLGLTKKPNYTLKCYEGENTNSTEPFLVFKKDKNTIEWTFRESPDNRGYIKTKPNQVTWTENGPNGTLISDSLLSPNGIVRSGQNKETISVKKIGNIFEVSGGKIHGPIFSYNDKNELVLRDVIFGPTNNDGQLTFTSVDGKPVLERKFSAQLHTGEIINYLYPIKTKDSFLLYDKQTYGLIVTLKGNRFFIDQHFYMFRAYYNCEILP